LRRGKKHLDFEINLIPFIDLLSACICFLLLTAVWVQVGSMDVKQAVGGQPASETPKKPTLWVQMGKAGEITLTVQDTEKVPAKLRKLAVKGDAEGKTNTKELDSAVTTLKNLEPELRTALIQPAAESVYEDMIALMDGFKKQGLIDLGVAPL
jgi:biopolymer transport protein ExbD